MLLETNEGESSNPLEMVDLEANEQSKTDDINIEVDGNLKDIDDIPNDTSNDVVSESSVDYDPLELASIIALTDFGSYMVKKVGKAGDSPELDQLPYFASMRRRWYFLIWEGEPDEWRLVSTKDRVDDPYYYDFKNEESPIYLKDISDIYLEPPPNLGIRLYRNQVEVIQLSPLSYSKAEATAWADAFRAAFSLQEMAYEVSRNIRQRYYELLSHQAAIPPSGRRHSRELVAYQEVDEEYVLGDGIPDPSPRSQSGQVLVEQDPPEPGEAGCFSRWFGTKKSTAKA
jgi:hypothetical protein